MNNQFFGKLLTTFYTGQFNGKEDEEQWDPFYIWFTNKIDKIDKKKKKKSHKIVAVFFM